MERERRIEEGRIEVKMKGWMMVVRKKELKLSEYVKNHSGLSFTCLDTGS